jgi:hypothetical protein
LFLGMFVGPLPTPVMSLGEGGSWTQLALVYTKK